MGRQLVFRVVEAVAAITILVVLLWLLRPIVFEVLRPSMVDAAIQALSPEERAALYQEIARDTGTLWDVVPDHEVARVAKREVEVPYRGVEVRTNQAGMRSSRPFGPKRRDTYRIVFLGDSFVFGEGGLEEDRFSDQVEEFYRLQDVRVDDRRIEVLAVGLPSWTLVQETAYLSRRLSAYSPDLVVVVSTANDITDSFGVTGAGTVTTGFSPEHRDWGSAVFSNLEGRFIGLTSYTALTTDVAPEAIRRWDRAMRHLKRLVDLQRQRGGRMMITLVEHTASEYFVEIFKGKLVEHGIDSPFLRTDFFASPETQLDHDPHPNRRGHEILAQHFIHAFDSLGWVDVADGNLPPLDSRLSLSISHPPSPESLVELRERFVKRNLRSELDFRRIDETDRTAALGLLGGVLLESDLMGKPPWASVRSGFVLRRPEAATIVELELDVPARQELFPLVLDVYLDTQRVERRVLPDLGAAGAVSFSLGLPAPSEVPTVEVILEASAHFSEIEDARTKSFRIVSARVK